MTQIRLDMFEEIRNKQINHGNIVNVFCDNYRVVTSNIPRNQHFSPKLVIFANLSKIFQVK